ncbi:MAG: hypothetical protein ACRD3W_22510, partial [Terriglobales bacterium]
SGLAETPAILTAIVYADRQKSDSDDYSQVEQNIHSISLPCCDWLSGLLPTLSRSINLMIHE